VIQAADADRPDHRAADTDWHAAVHLDCAGGDCCRPAGVNRRLQRMCSFPEAGGGMRFAYGEIDADRTRAFHLFKQDQVAGGVDDGERRRRRKLLRLLFCGVEQGAGAVDAVAAVARILRLDSIAFAPFEIAV
jgi:hypothetical protein